MAFAQTLLERIVQLPWRECRFARLEVLAHRGFVDLHHLIEDALMRFSQR